MEKNSTKARVTYLKGLSPRLSQHKRQEFDFGCDTHLEPVSLLTLIGKDQEVLFDHAAYDDQAEIIQDIIESLMETMTAKTLVSLAASRGYKIALGFLEEGGYQLDTEHNILMLDNFGLATEMLAGSVHYKNQILISLVRGLRDIWHECRISDIYEVLNPEHIIKIERFRAADVEAVTAHILWQMRNEGHNDAWRNLISDESGDIALSYMQIAEDVADEAGYIKALNRAFRQWFTDSNRSDACDHDALELMDEMALEKGFAKAFGRHTLNAEALMGMMALPCGTRYLTGLQSDILTDPFYAGFHDTINQAHLFHIMQDREGHMAAGVAFQNHELAMKIFPDRTQLL